MSGIQQYAAQHACRAALAVIWLPSTRIGCCHRVALIQNCCRLHHGTVTCKYCYLKRSACKTHLFMTRMCLFCNVVRVNPGENSALVCTRAVPVCLHSHV